MEIKSKSQSISSFNNMLNKLCYIFIIFSSLFFFLVCMNSQDQNWDMLGYAASALTLDNQEPEIVHEYLYRELQNYVSEEDFEKLTKKDSYRKLMSEDSDAFNQQIPYYKIRIVFVGLIFILVSLGVNIFTAGHVITAAAAALGLVVFFHAYRNEIKPVFFRALLPLLFVLTGVIDAGQKTSADSLAYCWLGLICYAFIRKHWAVFPLLVLSVLIRTDMVIFVLLVLTYYFAIKPEWRVQACVSVAATAVLYFGVNELVGNYGWSTVFYFVFISDMLATHPLEFSNLGVSLQQYFTVVLRNSIKVVNEDRFWVFVLNVLLQLILFFRMKNFKSLNKKTIIELMENPVTALTMISCGYIAIHYLLFPVLWSRFFIGQYMIAALGLIYILTRLIERDTASYERIDTT